MDGAGQRRTVPGLTEATIARRSGSRGLTALTANALQQHVA
jgi:hypothetical protein